MQKVTFDRPTFKSRSVESQTNPRPSYWLHSINLPFTILYPEDCRIAYTPPTIKDDYVNKERWFINFKKELSSCSQPNMTLAWWKSRVQVDAEPFCFGFRSITSSIRSLLFRSFECPPPPLRRKTRACISRFRRSTSSEQ